MVPRVWAALCPHGAPWGRRESLGPEFLKSQSVLVLSSVERGLGFCGFRFIKK